MSISYIQILEVELVYDLVCLAIHGYTCTKYSIGVLEYGSRILGPDRKFLAILRQIRHKRKHRRMCFIKFHRDVYSNIILK